MKKKSNRIEKLKLKEGRKSVLKEFPKAYQHW
jgi:hypothetical protein